MELPAREVITMNCKHRLSDEGIEETVRTVPD
jgi:hypothetical protein